LGLKDEHELQSYFIQRMEKYINENGKTLIGWDEILEGGLAPKAVVMSWRGEKGGIEAANQNHNVIMTPEKPVYFDHTQTKNEDSLVIGGYNSIDAVYAYEPIPKQLSSEAAKYVLGAQANLWTEYISNPAKVQYMIFPRMSALSEVLWSPKEKKSWNDFEKRLETQFKRYDLWKVNYSKAYYDVKVSLMPTSNYQGLQLTAEPRNKNGTVRYEVAGQAPVIYTKPVMLNKNSDVAVAYYMNNRLVNRVPLSISFNKATGKKISITNTPNERYPGQGGAFSLVNGVYSRKGLSHPDWLGWIGDDLEATIDLTKKDDFSSVKIHTNEQNGSRIYLPQYVEVLTSNDGQNFTSVGKSNEFVKDTLTMGWITVTFPAQSARYLKVLAKNYGMIPDGKPGAGNKAWLIIDEIQVD